MRPSAGDRLRRMLSVLAYLAETGGASIDDLAQRFGLAPDRMREELVLVSMCGLPPYTELIDLDVYDDWVSAMVPHYLRRPARLSRAEGFAVLTAGRTLAAVEGGQNEALEQALDVLADALGVSDDHIGVVLDEPPLLDVVRRAADRSETLDLTYYSLWRDTESDRRVDPLRVALADGEWYVDVFDHERADTRKLRVSRIRAATATGETFVHDIDLGPPTSFEPPPDAVPVRVLLPLSAAWAAEVYPATAITRHDDGSIELELHVVGTTWLERLMLRAGPDAKILDPPELVDLPAKAASRLLAAYPPP